MSNTEDLVSRLSREVNELKQRVSNLEFQNKPFGPIELPKSPVSTKSTCTVCKLDFGTQTWGYVCTNENCPTKVVS